VSYERVKAKECKSVKAALVRLTSTPKLIERVLYGAGTRHLLRERIGPTVQMFRWRYRDGLSTPEIARRYEERYGRAISVRQVRYDVAHVGAAVEWMTKGTTSQVYVPPSGYGKSTKAEHLRYRLADIAGSKSLPQDAARLARSEKAEKREQEPIFLLNSDDDLKLDLLKRRRYVHGGKKIATTSAPPRVLAQDLMLILFSRAPKEVRVRYRLGSRILQRWRTGTHPVQTFDALRRLMKSKGPEAGWAALVLLKYYGAAAVPSFWRRRLLTEAQFHQTERETKARKPVPLEGAKARKYTFRLWSALGQSRGVSQALPASMRDKETTRQWFRAVRRWMVDLSFPDGQLTVGAAVSPIDFLAALMKGETLEVDTAKAQCGRCRNVLPKETFSWRNREKGKRASYCKTCMRGIRNPNAKPRETVRLEAPTRRRPMPVNQRRRFKLLGAAQGVAKDNDVELTRKELKPPKPRRASEDYASQPTPIERAAKRVSDEFSLPIGVTQELDEDVRRDRSARRAERAAERLVERATGGSPKRDLRRFVRSVQGTSI
jgi:hypothetical protein